MKEKTDVHVWQKLFALLFPPKCVGCREVLPLSAGDDRVFCPVCQSAWEAGRLSPSAQLSRICDASSELPSAYPMIAVSVVKYRSGQTDGIPEQLIYHIKHQDERRVFAYAARQLLAPIHRALREAESMEGTVPGEIVISYPPRRPQAVRKEGFDQAKRLGQALSQITGWPLHVLIARTGEKGREQKRLDAEERTKNASMAYELSETAALAQHKTVILLDDLYTTGATLRTCAELLLEAGATRVILATVGRTVQTS